MEAKLDNINICNGVCERLSPFLDKELPKEEIAQISQHILACSHCRRDYERLKDTQATIKDYLERTIPEKDKLIWGKALMKLEKSRYKREFFNSIAAVIMIAVLSWFSINTVDPIMNENLRQSKIIKYDPAYLKAEDYLFKQAWSSKKNSIAEGLLLASVPAYAELDGVNISWESLHLTSGQEKEILILDQQWAQIRDLIRPRLIRDQECLKLMMINPDITDSQIREMQKYIFIKQEQLRYGALEIFLAKKIGF